MNANRQEREGSFMTDFDCACALWREHVLAAQAGEARMAHLKLGAYFDAIEEVLKRVMGNAYTAPEVVKR
jgi:hypothetical protein